MKKWIDIYFDEIVIASEVIALLIFVIGLLTTACTLATAGPIVISIGFALHVLISIFVSKYIFKK